MTPEPDDRELLRRHGSGDRDAFGELVARHRDRLWRLALRTLGHPEDAADALQDALLSAYRGAGTFRGDAAVTTWLHRIVVNACLDVARRNRTRRSEPLDPHLDAVAGPDPFPSSEAAADLLAALRALPVEQTSALVLVDIEGFPVAEAAEVLGVPTGTVKSRCARGRAALARLLEERNTPAGLPVQPAEAPQPRSALDEERDRE